MKCTIWVTEYIAFLHFFFLFSFISLSPTFLFSLFLRFAFPASLFRVSLSCAIFFSFCNFFIFFPRAQEGLTQFVNGGTWESEDGIHPNVWRDGQLGAMLALAVGSTLNL